MEMNQRRLVTSEYVVAAYALPGPQGSSAAAIAAAFTSAILVATDSLIEPLLPPLSLLAKAFAERPRTFGPGSHSFTYPTIIGCRLGR